MKIKRIISLTLCVAIIGSFCGCGKSENAVAVKSNNDTVNYEKGSYSEYISQFKSDNVSADTIVILNEKAALKSSTFEINSPVDALYELCFEYKCDMAKDAVISLKLDGELPFDDCEKIKLPAIYRDAGDEFKTLKNGDQAASDQVLYGDFVKTYAKDYIGKTEGRYKFYLTKGKHTVNIDLTESSVIFKNIAFVPEDGDNKYTKPSDLADNDALITVEAEKALYKNSKYLLPLSGTESALNPIDAKTRMLNYIGGDNWSDANSTIYWSIDVEKSGYYSVSFNYRQNQNVGGSAYRALEIDGESPFDEASRICFNYGSGFETYTFADSSKTPYYFYLEKGKHILSLAATPGPLSEIYYDLKNLTADMSQMYLEMTMIIGETVDPNRSYELFNKIPNFNDRLEAMVTSMNKIIEKLNSNQEFKSNTNSSTLQNAIRVLRQMIDNPYLSHLYKSDFYDSTTDLSAMMGTVTKSALDLDRIVLTGYNSPKKASSNTAKEKFAYWLKRVILSYTADYGKETEKADNKDALELWINWGRDQANAITTMIQDDFVPATGIDVNVSIANATIIQAILSGKGPDVMLQLARTDPVNYAMRGALLNLDEFSDFDSVISRFSKDAVLPYTYNDKVYALPDTQSFFVMFVREDICNSLGIKIPDTWDEYIDTAMQLQLKNLSAYIPYTKIADSGTSNTGVGGMSLYPTLLLQNGLKLYKEDKSQSLLSGTEQVKLFSNWTDLYTKYKFQVQADFLNRFRIGTMPIGIYSYTLYATLMDAAPEIDGKWYMTYIPGTQRADGTIDRSVAGSGSGCSITRLTKNKENAWEFLKWWTSCDTQLKYSNKLESILGNLGRVASSNIEAISKMDYDESSKKLLLDVINNNVMEIEEVPGGYYTARGIDQAFWATVEQDKMPIDSLIKWAETVDDEIARKTAEYS